MLRNYLRTALRNLLRHKVFSLINLLGLAVGMACCILILLYVRSELSYDRFHANAGRIWRVTREFLNEDGATNLHLGHVAPPIAPLLANDYAEIERAVRVLAAGPLLVAAGPTRFLEERILFVDDGFFEVFSFPLLRGDPGAALSGPNDVVITPGAARKYFGDADPVGRTLRLDDRLDLRVTGIVSPAPSNSHFHFELLGSLKAIEAMYGRDEFRSWGSNNYATYLLMPAGYPMERLQARFPAFLDKHLGPEAHKSTRLRLQRLTDIHLRSHLDSEIEANSDIAYVYLFSAIALFILIIAGVNFMNLTTARSSIRAREIGLRKVVGAARGQLVRQFLGESLLLSLFALVLAVAAVLAAKPAFAAFVGRELSLDVLRTPWLGPGLFGIAVFVGVAAGIYPAFVLSSWRPAGMLKGSRGTSGHGAALRTALVVFQFAISIVLIVCVGAVSRQLEYARTKRLGFDKDQVLVASMGEDMRGRYDEIRAELRDHPGVVAVAASRRVPSGRLLDSAGAQVFEGTAARPVGFRVAYVCVDPDFIETYRMTMAAGRNFSRDVATDAKEAFVINEAAARGLGWTPDQAVGKEFVYGRSRRGRIIGVVRDFHFESLHQTIAPLVFFIAPEQYRILSVRVHPAAVPATVEFLRKKWSEWRPGYPFDYAFLDERFASLYESERKLGTLFRDFALLAIVIACLGLYGLASFSADRRTREIGIRKALGATAPRLAAMMSRDFTRWVALANVIAWPAAYVGMESWLRGFAYRTTLPPGLFVGAGTIALAIALLTVGGQAIRAASGDPAKALRIE